MEIQLLIMLETLVQTWLGRGKMVHRRLRVELLLETVRLEIWPRA